MFQFHNGTIKTIWDLIVCGDPPLFQFHNGTIKTIECFCDEECIISFNSITVQLRPIKYSKKTSNNKQVIQ